MRPRILTVRSVIAAVISGASAAHAAPLVTADAPDDSDGVQQIVVTAERRSESSNRVPMSVQALSGESLSQLHVEDVSSLAAATPGFQVAPAYSGVPILSIRGIGFNSVNVTATSTVGVYQDELAYPYPSMAKGPIYDLE